MLKFLTEAIGSLILVLSIGLTTDPIAAGLLLVALLYAGFFVCNIHLNPAVSLGVWTLGEEDSGELFLRLSGQFFGAFSASFIVSQISRIPYVPGPSAATGLVEFIFLELLFSALFVLLFLVMIYPVKKRKKSLFGLVIGVGFAGSLLVIEPMIGFGMHPALNASFTLIDYLDSGDSYIHLPIYLFTPLVAAIIAGIVHRKWINIQG